MDNVEREINERHVMALDGAKQAYERVLEAERFFARCGKRLNDVLEEAKKYGVALMDPVEFEKTRKQG